MPDHRVDDLRLHVRADRRGEGSGPAEQFVANVLEAVGDRLEARWPGRLFFLRSLDLHWKMGTSELSDPAAVSRYGEQIAASFGDQEPQHAGARMPETGVVVFRDEQHWWACYLAAIAAENGESREWAYEGLRGKGVGLASLAGRPREFALAVLVELAEAGWLVRVARASAQDQVATLYGALRAPATGGLVRDEAYAAALEAARTLRRSVSSGLTRETLWLIACVEVVRFLRAPAEAGRVSRVADTIVEEVTSQTSAGDRETGPEGMALSYPSDDKLGETAETPPSDSFSTGFGGLFYLLSVAMELEVGEILWKACLPEGTVLAQAAMALLGTPGEDDPAAMLFGGVPALQPLDISSERQQEIAPVLLANLAAALPRRSLAKLPEVVLQLVRVAGVPALVAAERESPFCLFVWSAPDARSVAKGIQKFLSGWPPSAPRVVGTPSIAEVEGRVRIRAAREPLRPPALLAPEMGSAWASALIAQIAGALCHVFAARAGMDEPLSAAAVVDRYFAVPAKIALRGEEMMVTFSMSSVKVPLRRAGLDRDPGWVPWLRRTVRFVFEEDGAET